MKTFLFHSRNGQTASSFLRLLGFVLFSGSVTPLASARIDVERSGDILILYRTGQGSADREHDSMRESLIDSLPTQAVQHLSGSALGSALDRVRLLPGLDPTAVVRILRRNPMVQAVQLNHLIRVRPIVDAPANSRVSARTQRISQPNLRCWIPGVAYPPGCINAALAPAVDPALRPLLPTAPNQSVPGLASNWGFFQVGGTQLWQNPTSFGQQVIVAVIDTGIDYNHPDLAQNLWRYSSENGVATVGADFINHDDLPYDDNDHGTHCAGIIGARERSEGGIRGLAPAVRLMALKVMDEEGAGDTAAALEAFSFALTHGAKVLSNSWSSPNQSDAPLLAWAVQKAQQQGVLVVAAAGNEHENLDQNPVFPAGIEQDNVISVAASQSDEELASFSNYGARRVHLAAPGHRIRSTVSQGEYFGMSGSSMAAPFVSAAAVALWSAFPSLGYQEIRRAILEGVDTFPGLLGKVQTGGRLNVYRSYLHLMQRQRRVQ